MKNLSPDSLKHENPTDANNVLAAGLSRQPSFRRWSTDDLIDCLPQNRPLYKDSGLWQIRTDDMENIYMQQNCNETFRGFIIRYLEWLEEHEYITEVRIDLSLRDMQS